MFIIFGTRGVESRGPDADFHCPSCNGKRYQLVTVRRFFIPIIPLDKLGEYVECQTCNSTYNERVLDWDPEGEAKAFQRNFSIAAKRVMMRMALVDGKVDEAEIDRITESFQAMSDEPIDKGDIRAELEAAKSDDRPIEDHVRDLVGQLDDKGKERFLTAAVQVAMADNEFDSSEFNLVVRIGEALDMTKAHINGIIAQEAEAHPELRTEGA